MCVVLPLCLVCEARPVAPWSLDLILDSRPLDSRVCMRCCAAADGGSVRPDGAIGLRWSRRALAALRAEGVYEIAALTRLAACDGAAQARAEYARRASLADSTGSSAIQEIFAPPT